MPHDRCQFPAEFKFVDNGGPGEIEGYGSTFNGLDSHGDKIAPGAFTDTLAQHKAADTMPAMFVEHSYFFGGDPLPVGHWTDVSEDANGLRVKGTLIGMDDPHIKRVHALLKAKTMRGLSIAFTVPDGGSVKGKQAGEPRRLINKLDLFAIDIVRDPSNPQAQIHQVKAMMVAADHQTAKDCVASAIKLHQSSTAGGNSPNVEQRAQMLAHLQGAHKALTGEAMPPGTKSVPTTIREFEAWLREEFGLSNSQARDLAEHGFKTAPPRDEDGNAREAVDQFKTLAGFSL